MNQKTAGLARGANPTTAPIAKPKQSSGERIIKILDRLVPEMAKALPKHLTPDRMARLALTEFRKNPDLARCSAESIMSSIMRSSQLGLEIGADLGLAFLVPYGEECQLIIGYQGLVELARRSGMVRDIYAYPVRKGDVFQYKLGLNRDIIHDPAEVQDLKPEAITHVYGVCHMVDGGKHFQVMSRAEVDEIRAQSRTRKGGPWVTHFEAMAIKTVLRKLCKLLPRSAERMQKLAIAASMDEATELGFAKPTYVDMDTGEVMDFSQLGAGIPPTEEPDNPVGNGTVTTVTAEVIDG